MKRRAFIFCAVALAGLAVGTPACFGGPPFVTDDPETVEYQHWEVYFAAQYRHEHTGDTFAGAPSVEVNYGVVPDVQLHVIAPMAFSSEQGQGSHFGYGDTELGVKYRFVHETDSMPQIGVFPLVEAPTGDRGEGLGNGHTQIFLPLWIQKSWDEGKWTAYGGGGWESNPGTGNRDFWRFGAVLQRKVTEQLALGAELYEFTKSAANTQASTGFNIGGVFDITENHHILFSAGRDFSGPNRFSCYLAYQLTF